MITCGDCGRHHMQSEESCPFCGPRNPRRGRRMMTTIGAVMTPMVLAACYGQIDRPYYDTSDTGDTAAKQIDIDGDGFSSVDDCDDANAEVNPSAAEVCDDKIDNDCDGLTDAKDVKDCPA